MEDKYIAAFTVQIKNLFAYRTTLLLKLIRPVFMTVVVASFWVLLFTITGQEEIGGFTMYSFIVYLLIVRFIASLSPGSAAIGTMNEEIRNGNLVMRLVKPVHYLRWLFYRSLPVPLASGFIGITLVYVLSFIYSTAPIGWMLVLFLFSLVATILLQYAVYQLIGLLSFWIYEIWSIQSIFTTVRMMLSGEFIPLTLFSPMVQTVLQFLPFASFAFVPAGIFVGLFSVKMGVLLVGVQFIWAVLFWLLAGHVYKNGLKKFEAQGG